MSRTSLKELFEEWTPRTAYKNIIAIADALQKDPENTPVIPFMLRRAAETLMEEIKTLRHNQTDDERISQ